MTAFVLDASIAISWCFAAQASPATDVLLARVRTDNAIVPALWWWEVSNVMTMAVRRNRISLNEAVARFSLLAALPISIDQEAQARAWRETFLMAEAHALTAYDAAYLELALRLGLELATRDADLARAASAVGVTVLP